MINTVQELRSQVDNTEVEVYVLVTSVVAKNASNGMYLDVELQDSTGTVTGKVWQASEGDIERYTELEAKVVRVNGTKVTYRNQVQLKIVKIELATNAQLEKFIEKAPIDAAEIQMEIEKYMLDIRDAAMLRIIKQMMNKHGQLFYTYPAASKNHHNFMSGLAYHTLSMLRLAEQIGQLYPSLNMTYLYAGIIAHDFGKVLELSGVVATSYTTYGKLIGHINIAYGEVEVAAHELGLDDPQAREAVMILQHLILSHHGKYEFGSPKLPHIREAEVLNFIDNLDARIITLDKALAEVPAGSFTPRIFSLENRQFYKPKYEENKE
jgi:3'-5' exoribonuclease